MKIELTDINTIIKGTPSIHAISGAAQTSAIDIDEILSMSTITPPTGEIFKLKIPKNAYNDNRQNGD